ncbi:MAG: outer membrane beta-barrel protein [Bacteroidales bacterium]
MDLRIKILVVHINFFEQNIALSKNKKWGIVTGLGTSWNNYRFSKDTRLNSDSSQLIGYVDSGISIRKTKLTNWYLNIPLIFEFQTNSYQKKNSFHIAAGMIMGVRLSTHTKKYYDERNKEYTITIYDPESDKYINAFPEYEKPISPNYSKAKNYDDYYLNPFKWDATVRIGWGFINLFATYSVNTMFKKDKGPELYPDSWDNLAKHLKPIGYKGIGLHWSFTHFIPYPYTLIPIHPYSHTPFFPKIISPHSALPLRINN